MEMTIKNIFLSCSSKPRIKTQIFFQPGTVSLITLTTDLCKSLLLAFVVVVFRQALGEESVDRMFSFSVAKACIKMSLFYFIFLVVEQIDDSYCILLM